MPLITLRLTAAVLGAGLALTTATAAAATPAHKTTLLGSLGSCTTSSGALVAVDFSHWGGPAVRGCDPNPTTGIALLQTAKFTTAGTKHDGPQFICRIGSPLYKHGAQYPTRVQDACVSTPPTTAYWSHWLARKGSNTWTYSSLGAFADQTKAGEVEAWTFGRTSAAGTTGKPAFTPNQVRAGLKAGVKVSAQSRSIAATPDLVDAAKYVVGQLVGGHYAAPFGGGFADYGLTLDAGLALAATGTDDAALHTLVTFLDHEGKDGQGRTINDYTGIGTKYASGGSIGKEALLAEVAGYNPRSFGGHNLIKALDGLVCTKKTTSCAGAGNYAYSSSTFSQTLAILAQLRAGDAAGAAKPITFLQAQQHSSGAFPSQLPVTASDSETDSTGMAAMALALVNTAKARAEVAKALAWLASKQEKDGGFPGASGDSVNSAAIVSQALHLDARTYAKQIAKGEAFLAAEQNSDGGFSVAAGQSGSDLRASTQALGGAVGTPFGSLLDDVTAKTDATSGAGYLVAQLTDGTHYTDTYDGTVYPEYGPTADALFALLATGTHAETANAMFSWLEAQVDAYGDPNGTAGGPYSGGLAKLALVAEADGGNPHAFGGTNLLQVIRSHVCTKAIAGTYSPCTATGDVYNAFSTTSQALAVLALQASPYKADHLSISSPLVVRLHQLQCKDGGFSSVLIKPGAACTSDVDTTGYAVQALAAVKGTDTWLGAAQAYLQKQQKSSGLYPGASGINANSTALATQGLQTLVGALTSATADPPQPKTITPIVALQSALKGLRSLSVAGGGFGITTAKTADLISATQAVTAAAQRTLLSLSGAPVLSLPRVPAVSSSGGSTHSATPTATATPTASTVATTSITTSTPIIRDSAVAVTTLTANTGVPVVQQVTWALALMAGGALLAWLGRRRVAVVTSRHRLGRRH